MSSASFSRRRSRGHRLAALLLGLSLVPAWRIGVDACTVFFAFDGRLALAGQNEDWDDANTQFWVVPATATTHGVVYFGFGRGDYPANGITFSPKVQALVQGRLDRLDALTPEDLYGLPQQGMNDKGLFFGGAQTDPVETPSRSGRVKLDRAIVDLILRRCGSVAEALKMLEVYDYVMPAGQVLFADKSGASFILEAGRVILRQTGRHQVMTNFLQSREPDKRRTDRRYTLVDERLRRETNLSRDVAASLLEAAQQHHTQYSLVFDLTHGEITVYRDRRFDQRVTLNIQQALAKGAHAGRIRSLFSTAIQ